MIVASAFFTLVLGQQTTAAQCVPNSTGGPLKVDENGNPTNRIYLYFDDEIHTKLAAASPETVDDSLSRTQAIQAAMMAAEVWNQQSRSMALVYGGLVDPNVDDRTDFCNSQPVKQPAVYVTVRDITGQSCGGKYSNGSLNYQPNDWCSGQQVAEVALDTGGHCPQHTGILSEGWPIGSHGQGQTTGVFVHEFGHVVGLGHPGYANNYSVMNKSPLAKADGGIHLLNWDKTCADWSWSPGRSVRTQRFGWKPDGTHVQTETDSNTSGKGTILGGWLRDIYGAPHYATYYDTFVEAAAAYYDGHLTFYPETMADLDLYNLDETPTLFSAHEYSYSTEPMRYLFLDDEDDSTGDKWNPPEPEYVVYDVNGDGSPGPDVPLLACQDYFYCLLHDIRTHVPVVTAWDPVSQVTITSWVETYSERVSGAPNDPQGYIWLHAGFHAPDTLNAGTKLDPAVNVTRPSSGSSWWYEVETFVPPAIACADSKAIWNGYNCIVAWTDKGLGSTNGNNVLYHFFRVDSTGTGIELAPGTISIRHGSNTVGQPSAAFFDGKIWLGWKALQTPSHIELYSRPNASTGWTNEAFYAAQEAVDPPTFGYHPSREVATIWTLSE